MSDTFNQIVVDPSRLPGVDPQTVAAEHLTEDVVTLLTPSGLGDWQRQVLDLEKYADEPNRSKGSVIVHDAPSFLHAVIERADQDHRSTGLYADEDNLRLTAVLNDDEGGRPGWRDYRVALNMRVTTEWSLWVGNEGLHDQTRFAEIVEEGLAEITNPAAATMLEMAQTFHATTQSKVKLGNRLRTGETQVMYEENIDASAGQAGDIVIPETFTLALRPFLGADKYEVNARIRFRLQGGNLRIGYKLARPDDIKRAAFQGVVDQVSSGLSQVVIAGTPPAER